jgi:endonuclease/exonuclease/phosphatase family metal-dependent hydrolase
MDWIDLAQERDQCRVIYTVMNLYSQKHFGNFLSSCITDDHSRRVHLHEVVREATHVRLEKEIF